MADLCFQSYNQDFFRSDSFGRDIRDISNINMAKIDPVQTKEYANELIKLSIVSTGTYLSTKLFLRLVKNPVILFGSGLVAGYYVHKNRKQIIGTLLEAKHQTQQMLNQNKP